MRGHTAGTQSPVRFSDLNRKTVGIWGLGKETAGFLDAATRRLPDMRVVGIAVDGASASAGHAKLPPLIDGEHAAVAFANCDAVVRSPGVSVYRPEMQRLRSLGIPTVTPTALWLAERGSHHVIGVTGTKGKSTTCALLVHLMRAQGVEVELAGNIGRPALELLDAPSDNWAVIELSSYQITDLARGPQIAVVTNVYREHVDWHGSHAQYRADKLRLLDLPGVAEGVLTAGQPELAVGRRESTAISWFGADHGWNVTGDVVKQGSNPVVSLERLPLKGMHTAMDLCAALTVLDAIGMETPILPQALRGFDPLPHRMQRLLIDGRREWIDDSASTTPESTIAAIRAFSDRPLLVIVGGLERGQDHRALAESLVEARATIIGLPVTGHAVVSAALAAGVAPRRATAVEDMEAAVRRAHEMAGPGERVLLSPAAASYNAFRDFNERGDVFQELAAACCLS